MTEPVPAAYGPRALRIGDAERDAAAEALSGHFAAGRLDRVELDERLATTYAAKTGGELLPLFADLPGPLPTALQALLPDRSPEKSPTVSRRDRRVPAHPVFVLVLLVLAVVGSIGAVANGHPPVPLFVAFLVWRFSGMGGWGRRGRAYGPR